MKEFQKLKDLYNLQNKLSKHYSPINDVLREQMVISNRLKELSSPTNKIIADINKNYKKAFSGLSPFSDSPEIQKLSELYNSEFYNSINDSISFREKIIPKSFIDNVHSIINDSSIEVIRNLSESSIFSIKQNFENIGINSESATISFIENVNNQEIDLSEEELVDLSEKNSLLLKDFIVNPKILSWFFYIYLSINLTPNQTSIEVIYLLMINYISGILINYNYDNIKDKFNSENPKCFKIELDSLELKSKPKKDSKTILLLTKESEIFILKSNYKWVYILVKDSNNKNTTGWIKKVFIDFS